MTFFGLSPWLAFGALALAAGVLFALHWLRVRPQVTRVPTLLFWREAAEETRARSLFDRFRHPRTFLLLLALLAALVFALADPRSNGAEAATRHYALVIDPTPALGVSADEADLGGADSGGVGSLRAEMLQSVRVALRDIALRDRVAVFAPDLVADFDDPRGHAIDRAAASEVRAACDWDALLARARSRLAGRSRPRLIVFTGPDVPAALAAAASRTANAEKNDANDGDDANDTLRVQVVRHGKRPVDRGLGAVAFDDALSVEVESNAAAPARRLVARNEAGATIATADVPAAPAAGRQWIAIPSVPADGGVVSLALEPSDAVGANDTVRYRRPVRRTVRVHVAFDSPVADALVASDPRLARAADTSAADVVLAHGTPSETLRPETPIVEMRPPAFRDAAPASSFPAVLAPQRTIETRSAADVLLTAGKWPIAQAIAADGASNATAVLEVAPFLVDAGERFCRSAEGAAWLAETLRRLGGERPGQVLVAPGSPVSVLDDRRSEAPQSIHGLAPTTGDAPFARHAGGAVGPPTDAVEAVPARVGSGGFRAWEWLVLLGLVIASVDLWLQLRGRIP